MTPWVFILTHAPWYNTFNAHYLEGEVQRLAVEYFVRKYRVDAVFSGHVHAYERFVSACFFLATSASSFKTLSSMYVACSSVHCANAWL